MNPPINADACALFSGLDILLPRQELSCEEDLPLFSLSPERSVEFPGSMAKEELNSDLRIATFDFEGTTYASAELEDERCSHCTRCCRLPLRQFVGSVSQRTAAFVLKAKAFSHWAYQTRHCSFCGAALVQGRNLEDSRARVCPSCSRVYFPRISPAVIVLVNNGEKILLAHNAKMPKGRHGLVAGFVDPGETLEEAVRREVMEEAGIEILTPRYIRSQPWPFPDSLMLAFEADFKSGVARPDGTEIDHLGWYGIDELPEIPPPGSVARSLIENFIARRRNQGKD
ncbi:MAG: NAD(+) diphosphatase [Spirochaetia bacterium]|jgi:NAD+ diphosphatase|nr:NAD(+) diphosphatase [Spirochaetia bacterium]